MGSKESNDLKSRNWGAVSKDSLWKMIMNLFEFEAPIRHRGVDKRLHEEGVGFWQQLFL